MASKKSEYRVLLIHGLSDDDIISYMDLYSENDMKLVCYRQSEDPALSVFSSRELAISSADIVLIFPNQLPEDAETRATLVAAMDHYQSCRHRILLLQIGEEKWSPKGECTFIRLDELPTEKVKSKEDIVCAEFMDKIKGYCSGELDFQVQDSSHKTYGQGLAWNYMFGFVFNIMEHETPSDSVTDPLLIVKLKEYVRANPQCEGRTSSKIYLIVPYSPKLSVLMDKRKVEGDYAIKLKKYYAGLERDYNLSLSKFGPKDEEVYGLVVPITQFNPFFEMRRTSFDGFDDRALHACRTRFCAELHRILFSKHCNSFRDHVTLIMLQTGSEG